MTPPMVRFVQKVEVNFNTGCWEWRGALQSGYGNFWPVAKKGCRAHRWLYKQIIWATLPDDLDLDHLCRVRCCVNPAHLEPVVRKVNMERGMRACQTHCIKGHPYDEENTYVRPYNKTRACRTCRAIRNKNQRQNKRLGRERPQATANVG